MQDPYIVERPLLRDVCATFTRDHVQACEQASRSDLARDVQASAIPPQALAGIPANFSFLAYPVPRYTREQREKLDVVDLDPVVIPLSGGQVKLEIDSFGRVGWFYVEGLPQYFEEIRNGASGHAL